MKFNEEVYISKVLKQLGYNSYADFLANNKQKPNNNKTKKKKASDTDPSKYPTKIKQNNDDSTKDTEPYIRVTEHDEPDNAEILFQNIQNAKLALIKEVFEIMGDDFTDNDANIEYRNYLTNIILTPNGTLQYDESGNVYIKAEPYIGDPPQNWSDAVIKMGKWYEANVHTYQCGKNNKEASGQRLSYKFQDNWYVTDDCSGFVSACLQFYGVFNKGEIYSSYDYAHNSSVELKLKNSGFLKYAFTWDRLAPFDIIIVNDGKNHHIEIWNGPGGKYGTSWSWGNTYDGKNGHYGMPCPTTPYNYQYIYRKVS